MQRKSEALPSDFIDMQIVYRISCEYGRIIIPCEKQICRMLNQ